LDPTGTDGHKNLRESNSNQLAGLRAGDGGCDRFPWGD
jgi:hypothetical protein